MSISGVGSANSYIYENANRGNKRNIGTALFNQAENLFGSNSRGVSGQSSSFSANDAYNSMAMNGMARSGIGELYLQKLNCENINLWEQANGGIRKVESERYVIDVTDKVESNWCFIYSENDTDIYNEIMKEFIQMKN